MEFPVERLWVIWNICLKSMEGSGISTSLRRNTARRTGGLPLLGSWTSEMLRMPWTPWMEECMMEESYVCKWLNMTGMKARGNIEGEEVGLGLDPDPGAGEEDRGLEVDPSQGEGPGQDPDLEGDQDPILEILMESQKVDQGASRDQKVGQEARKGQKVDLRARAEKRRGAILSQVPDPDPNPDPEIEKRLFEHIGISLN